MNTMNKVNSQNKHNNWLPCQFPNKHTAHEPKRLILYHNKHQIILETVTRTPIIFSYGAINHLIFSFGTVATIVAAVYEWYVRHNSTSRIMLRPCHTNPRYTRFPFGMG